MTIMRAMLSGKLNNTQATLQMTGQTVTRKMFVKINLSW